MAKKRDFGNVAEGFFSVQQSKPAAPSIEKQQKEAAPAVAKPADKLNNAAIPATPVATPTGSAENKAVGKRTTPKEKKMGRPRADDLKQNEDVFKTSIYLTEETAFMIDSYALKKRIDRSEALRHLIREKCANKKQ